MKKTKPRKRKSLLRKIAEVTGWVAASITVLLFLHRLFFETKEDRILDKQSEMIRKTDSLQRRVDQISDYLDGFPYLIEGRKKSLFSQGITLKNQHRYDDAIKAFRACLSLKLSDSERIAVLLLIGNSFYLDGDLDEALGHYQEALKLSIKAPDIDGKATSLGNLGLVFADKGDPSKALVYTYDALNIFRERKDREGEANSLANIGLLYRDKGQSDSALDYLNDGLAIYQEIDSSFMFSPTKASFLNDLGIIHRDRREFDLALQCLEYALSIDRLNADSQWIAEDLGNIGVVYRDSGDLDKSLKYHTAALRINQGKGFHVGEANDLNNLGLVYGDKKEFGKALQYLRASLDIFIQNDLRPQIDRVKHNIRLTEEEKKTYERSLKKPG